jgi:hypothetical protein
VLPRLWGGRRRVRIFGRTVLGACRITPTARNPRRDDHNRREQCDEQEDTRGHDPHSWQHPILLCRLTEKKVHGSFVECKFAQRRQAVRDQRSAEPHRKALWGAGDVIKTTLRLDVGTVGYNTIRRASLAGV